MDAAFRIRYRVQQVEGTRRAMVIEDPQGVLYLFSGGHLQMRLNSPGAWRRVSQSLSRARYAWQSVESGALHPLEALPLLESQADGYPAGGGWRTDFA